MYFSTTLGNFLLSLLKYCNRNDVYNNVPTLQRNFAARVLISNAI